MGQAWGRWGFTLNFTRPPRRDTSCRLGTSTDLQAQQCYVFESPTPTDHIPCQQCQDGVEKSSGIDPARLDLALGLTTAQERPSAPCCSQTPQVPNISSCDSKWGSWSGGGGATIHPGTGASHLGQPSSSSSRGSAAQPRQKLASALGKGVSSTGEVLPWDFLPIPRLHKY